MDWKSSLFFADDVSNRPIERLGTHSCLVKLAGKLCDNDRRNCVADNVAGGKRNRQEAVHTKDQRQSLDRKNARSGHGGGENNE